MQLRIRTYLILLMVAGSAYFAWHSIAHTSRAVPPHGIWVYASHTCGRHEPNDNRTIVLQVRANRDIYLNADVLSEQQLPVVLAQVFEKREERVLRLTAEEDVSYGRVVEVISNIKTHVPRLAIVLLPRGTPEVVMNQWCISSGDIFPGDR